MPASKKITTLAPAAPAKKGKNRGKHKDEKVADPIVEKIENIGVDDEPAPEEELDEDIVQALNIKKGTKKPIQEIDYVPELEGRGNDDETSEGVGNILSSLVF